MSLQELDHHGITAVVIKMKKGNESKVGKDKYQNWAAAGGAFLLGSMLKICKVQIYFSHHRNKEGWWCAWFPTLIYIFEVEELLPTGVEKKLLPNVPPLEIKKRYEKHGLRLICYEKILYISNKP